MKLKSIFEADAPSTAGESIAAYSEDLAAYHEKHQILNFDRFLDLGAEAIQAGCSYKRTAKGFEFTIKRHEDAVVIRLKPMTGVFDTFVVNEGEQNFAWNDLLMSEFKDAMDGEFKDMIARMFDLIESLESCQRYIGKSPEFNN